MSGGRFDYKQHYITDIADSIQLAIVTNNERNYPPEIIERFRIAVKALRKAAKMVHHIDYLLSDDYGEETFLREWEREKKQNGK